MNGAEQSNSSIALWIPRVLIALSVLLLIYFTQVSYRFKGTYDDSFLAEENMSLIRGPLAHEDYYRMGQLDYKGADPFEDSLPADVKMPSVTSDVEIALPEELQAATAPELP